MNIIYLRLGNNLAIPYPGTTIGSPVKESHPRFNQQDLYSETSWPHLARNRDRALPAPAPKMSEMPETRKTDQANEYVFSEILRPYLNSRLIEVSTYDISTFIPSSRNMYFLIHEMDKIMKQNFYFKRQEDSWYPFISRIYFGILFIVQTLRAMITARIATPAHERAFMLFTKFYPLDYVPIPGPLVTFFSTLAPSTPINKLSRMVTPTIPSVLGPLTAQSLIYGDEAHSYELLIPNIPMLIGFANLVINAPADNIPDFTKAETFNNIAERTLNGHVFTANQWNQLERDALLCPGLMFLAEADGPLNVSFNTYGKKIKLPTIDGQTDISDILKFMCMQNSVSWFANVIQIMTVYCHYFQESKTLAQCETKTSVTSLLTNKLNKLSSNTAQENVRYTLTHAFSNEDVVSHACTHTSTEEALPPIPVMRAQCAQINIKINPPGLGSWSNIGKLDSTRTGSYWLRTPESLVSGEEKTYLTYGQTIIEKFALSRSKR